MASAMSTFVRLPVATLADSAGSSPFAELAETAKASTLAVLRRSRQLATGHWQPGTARRTLTHSGSVFRGLNRGSIAPAIEAQLIVNRGSIDGQSRLN